MVDQPSKERGCDGKMKLYERNYWQVAERMASKHGKRYGVYKCPHCKRMHLTTKLEGADRYKPLLYLTKASQ